MCAATSQMVAKVAELMELRKMIEDLNAEAELIADEIKAYMGDEETMHFNSNHNPNPLLLNQAASCSSSIPKAAISGYFARNHALMVG